jgi:hypothetical protein
VLGFRGWRVDVNYAGPGKPRLISPTIGEVVWNPGEWMIAECHGVGEGSPDPMSAYYNHQYHGPLATDPGMISPVKDCGGDFAHGCGFYAARDRAHLVSRLHAYTTYSPERPQVIGQVQMAGKIIFATNGFRAQRVRPRVIFVPYEAHKLGTALKREYGPYGVEIQMGTTSIMPAEGIGARKWCDRCKARLKNRTLICEYCGHNN